jgi:hypothetical protein
VFGKWLEGQPDQRVPSGWFDDTLKKSTALIAGPIEAAMVRVAEEATRRLF